MGMENGGMSGKCVETHENFKDRIVRGSSR
jgi:hypothetical protein